MATTMSKRLARVEADKLANTVKALLFRHAQGDVDAGNQAFEIGDVLTRELTASGSFAELLDAWTAYHYRPTLRAELDARYTTLADLYDYAQARRGVVVSAYRGVRA